MKNIKMACAAALIATAGASNAATLTDTLGEFNFDGGPVFPEAEQTVGTFTFDLDGAAPTSASISGTFGNSFAGSSAPFQLFADGGLIGSCLETDACYNSTVAFDFALLDLSVLLDGEVVLSVIQTAEFIIRLGETTLTVETDPSPVPLPAAGWMLMAGIAGFGALRRRTSK